MDVVFAIPPRNPQAPEYSGVKIINIEIIEK